jgi:glycosyltransferase involved in cell wall biosynthesis
MARVLHTFEPPDGGVAEHVVQVVRGLVARGHDVVVAGPRESPFYPELERTGAEVHRLPMRRSYDRPQDELAALRELRGLLRRGRFDLAHCHSAKAGVLGRLAARRTGVPAVYSPHGLPFVGPVSAARRRFATSVERRLARATAAYLFVSDAERRFAREAGVGTGRPMHVVHNGCAAPAPDAVARPELAGDGPLAAMVSVLRPAKGLEAFVDAAGAVLRGVPDARLAIVGDGPFRDAVVARVRERGLEGEPRFSLVGWRPPMAENLLALDVFALPSEMEAFPVGLIEAMACGVPQVASAVGGIPESVTPDTGVLVAPRDPDALAAALIALLGDPQRRARMSEASRARHAERFTLDAMVDGVAAVYETVLA